jgi:hypothetical protein
VATVEPERELIRRVTPFAPIAAVVAFAVGALFAGPDAGWSAAIAVVIVYVNFLATAYSLAWAAKNAPTLVPVVALGGYVARLIVYTVALVLLNQLEWFSPRAFVLALMPAVIGLLVYEGKALSGRMKADMWNFEGATRP